MDSTEPQESKKRRFKDPETFRERAVKASEVKDRPKTEHKKLKAFFRAVAQPFKPLVTGYKKLKEVPSLKPVFKVLTFIGLILVPKYLRTSFQELKLVKWPSWNESRRLTYAVLVFAIVFGVTVAAVDWGLGKIFKHILLK